MTSSQTDFLHVVKEYKKCPYCKTGDLDTRVKRNKLVKSLFFWMDLKRYACNNCGRKVYLVNKAK